MTCLRLYSQEGARPGFEPPAPQLNIPVLFITAASTHLTFGGKPRWDPERGWDLSKATQKGRGQTSGLGLSSSSESRDAGQRQMPTQQGKIIGLVLSPASPSVEEAMWCHQAKPWGLA